MIDDNFNCLFLVVCPGPWASQILSKLGINLPLIPVKIPVYYWKVKVPELSQDLMFKGMEWLTKFHRRIGTSINQR